jgi:hypothetical protein
MYTHSSGCSRITNSLRGRGSLLLLLLLVSGNIAAALGNGLNWTRTWCGDGDYSKYALE